MLHNEYVTQAMFDAITNHPNVIYLYPNALYAEIEVDYENNLITLITRTWIIQIQKTQYQMGLIGNLIIHIHTNMIIECSNNGILQY